MLRYPHLLGWTPIAFHAEPEAAVEWADLRGHAFDKPFFNRTLAAWRAGANPLTIRTDLDAFEELDAQPSLEPDLIIAHASRCGSTLLARLAALGEETLLVSEPPVIPQLLARNLAHGLVRPVEQVLREAVRSLGRVRFGTERRYVLKLNSQLSRFLPEFRRAFPSAPIVWLQRQPSEIIESNLKDPAEPHRVIPLNEATSKTVRRVMLAFMGATAFVDDRIPVLDYRELPDAAWTRVADLMGIDPAADRIARARDLAKVHAHNDKPFASRSRRPLCEAMQAVIRQTLDPMYDSLALRRSN
jgi:hypothetical protein